MADSPSVNVKIPDPPTDEPRLESWGEIAAYLRREIRTVQRWERYQGLPVRRLVIGKLGSVYAIVSELDKWYRERQPQPENVKKIPRKPGMAKLQDTSPSLPRRISRNPRAKAGRQPVAASRPRITRLHITITLLALLIRRRCDPAVYFLRGWAFARALSEWEDSPGVLPFANLSGDPHKTISAPA